MDMHNVGWTFFHIDNFLKTKTIFLGIVGIRSYSPAYSYVIIIHSFIIIIIIITVVVVIIFIAIYSLH